VGFPPGGVGDILARLVGQSLSERLGQPVIIENRPGAGSNVAAEMVVKAASDGYTLYWSSSANATSGALNENLSFNFMRDLAPIASISSNAMVMEVNPSVPAKTVLELVAFAKANPNKLNMASNGNATTSHLAGELFKMMTGTTMVHVPYRGAAPALTDLIAGQVQVMFADVTSSIEHVRTGKLRALAVTTTARSDMLPDVPTIAEFVPGYETTLWTGLCAPKNTPAEIITKLNREVSSALADPKLRTRFAELGAAMMNASPDDFRKFIAEDTDRWTKVIRTVGVKAE
jgi:tripartite-type tricarboxylate transporter receptor subunit TctC